MKALVLGGTGFIGMNLVRALVASGHQVTATRRRHGNTLFARRLGASLVHAELDELTPLIEVMRGQDVIFNCAGHYPRYSLDEASEVAVARRRTQNTLEAARRAGVGRYVLTSSVATIGPPRAGRACSDERDALEPGSLSGVYHSVKAAIEEEVLGAGRADLDVVVLVPTAVFGELDVKAGTGALIVGVGNRTLPFRVEGPTNVVDADDLARAQLLAAERGSSGERYIVGGHNLSVSALLEHIAGILAVPLEAPLIPLELASWRALLGEARARARNHGARPAMSRELVDMVRLGRHVLSDKAHQELRLPRPTPLSTTLEKGCDWYLRHRYIQLAQGGPDVRHFRRADPS